MESTHMMTFCPKRISYLLKASAHTVTLLPAFCDVLVTFDVKDKEYSNFMSPKALCILHILADLEPMSLKDYSRRVGTDGTIIAECYQVRTQTQ